MFENIFSFLTYLTWIVTSIITTGFFCFVLNKRWKGMPRWAMIAIYIGAVMVPSYLKMTHTNHEIINEICYWVLLVVTILWLMVMFQDKVAKKIAAFVIFTLITYVAEMITLLLYKHVYHITFDKVFDSMENLVLALLDCIVIIMLCAIFVMIWNKIRNKSFRVQNIVVFLIFPISQVMWCITIPTAAMITLWYGILALGGLLLGFVADFVLFYVMIEQSEKEETERRLLELEQLQKTEEIHYQAVEAHRLETSKLRHDYKNQLATVYRLMETGDTESSKTLLQEITAAFDGTKEIKYCNHPIVNAVLVEKAAVCGENQISLVAELDIEEEMKIHAIHMCSLFSNLLDNAIKACVEMPEAERMIQVNAGMRGSYFSIRVTNSSQNPAKKVSKRKGYGKEILRNIVELYEGDYSEKWENGIYTVKLSVVNEDSIVS